jgi:flotillin
MDMDQLQSVSPYVLLIPGAVLIALLIVVAMIKNFVYICRPNEILIFSGRRHVLADGRRVGFRVIHGGRCFRMPIIEKVERMDMSLISVPMTTQGAYSEGGIPLAVHAIANIKVSADPRFVGNAIERFLGHGRAEIARVAKETFEGHLRGVLATMTPEEVNEDRLKFANRLREEAEDDLEKLGLQLDTLKIQHVSDEANYLESIGRARIAEILRDAEVAESDAERAAKEAEAAASARGEVAHTRARASIQRKQNELRHIRADLDAEARSEEEKAEAAAREARAQAEQELQQIRGERAQLQLAADVTIPAEAHRSVRELEAAGNAASIAADGEAMAQALAIIAEAWRDSGGKAMDMFVLQHLDEIFGQVAAAAKKLDVREVNLVDSGDGKTLPAYLSAYPAAVGALLEQVTSTLGVDISRVITGADNGVAVSPPAPKPSTSTTTVAPPAVADTLGR